MQCSLDLVKLLLLLIFELQRWDGKIFTTILTFEKINILWHKINSIYIDAPVLYMWSANVCPFGTSLSIEQSISIFLGQRTLWDYSYQSIEIRVIQSEPKILRLVHLFSCHQRHWKVQEGWVLSLAEIFITPGHRILKPFKLVIIYIIMYTLTQFPWYHSAGEILRNCINVSIDEFVPVRQFSDMFKSPSGL